MPQQDDNLDNMRHSLAHILAYAVQELYQDVKFGVGPTIDNGFYYDFDLSTTISEDDLGKIEKKMREIVEQDYEFSRADLDIAAALQEVAHQPYKQELIHDLADSGSTAVDATNPDGGVDTVTFYKIGNFNDLCRGGHVDSTAKVGAFKLSRVSGAYWRGDESNQQMQRIYGVAFATQQELDQHLKQQAAAKERDHRKLGKELDLFTFSELVGSGLPLFTPRGTVVKNLLTRYSQQLRQQAGFVEVSIPHITKSKLYETSGHWDKFGDELFLVTSQETSDKLALKPMNCPHHTQIYASDQRSYRDLPLRYLETTTVYRDEKSGELGGLNRVRSITQDDSHVFCAEQDIGAEVNSLLEIAGALYSELGMDLRVRLSYRDDSEAYLGDDSLWQSAQKQLHSAVEKSGLNYFEETGEAAFYGPKIDFMATDAIGREHQLATVQLDFVQPGRFDLEYVAHDGSRQTPVMIHSAILGSAERFMSVYIEHTAGNFPFWLAPEQVRIIPVNDKIDDYITTVEDILTDTTLMHPLKYNEIRSTVDSQSDSLGKRIYQAEKDKVPVIIIAGPRDQKSGQVSLRIDGEESSVSIDGLSEKLQEL